MQPYKQVRDVQAVGAADHALLSALFDELFPLMRSITGAGTRKTIEILQRHMPLACEVVPSGTRIFDWVVPPEWRFRAARLTGPDGRIIADASQNTLRVLNYAEPVDRRLSLAELQDHLYSLPGQPEAIPYVTSYYERRWGFCLSQQERDRLPEGIYHAFIDTDFDDRGGVPFAHCVLEGESEAEIVLTSYICHPSLANNELSGPLTLLGLYDRLSAWPRRRFTYRFVLNPETIGSLCFLYRHGDHLRRTMKAGLVLSCTGGPAPHINYKYSRRGDAVFDRLADWLAGDPAAAHAHLGVPLVTRPFTPVNGSDERQFCSPGFNLPMGQVCKTVYGDYDGYHNSLDDKAFMGIDNLVTTIDAVERLLALGELVGPYVNLSPFGEPQLSKRNLYPSESWTKSFEEQSHDKKVDKRQLLNHILMILNYSDGHHDMLEIARMSGVDLPALREAIEVLEREKLLRTAGL